MGKSIRGSDHAIECRPRGVLELPVMTHVGPEDPRYPHLIRRGFNRRFSGNPDYVSLVRSTGDVVDAVAEAVRGGLRLAVRSGGHCLEGFVADPIVRALIDTSLMDDIRFDPEMGAFMVEAGATLGEVYRKLFLEWGVTLPAGESPDIGAGGHFCGDAFGFLCREMGLAIDYLYGVELVVVDDSGTVRSVVATRQGSDPNRELWWAHTGCGGGNFGIVTRYWFRSSDTSGKDPAALLPRAPESILVLRASWSWEGIDEVKFTTLVRNFGEWCEKNGGADSPFARMFTLLTLRRRQAGALEMIGVSSAGADAERLFNEHLAAVGKGVGMTPRVAFERTSWLGFALNPFPEIFQAGAGDVSVKVKDALLRRALTDRQIQVAYRHLTSAHYDVPGGSFGLQTYGGAVNTVAADATASAQRDSILSMACVAGWGEPQAEADALAWVRAFYRDLFADSGGVPVPGDACDGAMINHPDADLADPAWNTSGVPWHTLYYKAGYPRLQRIKERWDPQNIFHHALSIRST